VVSISGLAKVSALGEKANSPSTYSGHFSWVSLSWLLKWSNCESSSNSSSTGSTSTSIYSYCNVLNIYWELCVCVCVCACVIITCCCLLLVYCVVALCLTTSQYSVINMDQLNLYFSCYDVCCEIGKFCDGVFSLQKYILIFEVPKIWKNFCGLHIL